MGTGVLKLLGGEVRNRCVRSGPDSYSVIGEAFEHSTPRLQSKCLASVPSRLPAKTWYKFSI